MHICSYEYKMSADIDESGVVSWTQVVQNGCLIEVGQISHVVNFLELGRIHLLNRIFLDRLVLQTAGRRLRSILNIDRSKPFFYLTDIIRTEFSWFLSRLILKYVFRIF